MAGNHRIKIKIGDAEFEAEGSENSVQAQYEQFLAALDRTPKGATPPLRNSTPETPAPAPEDEALARLFEQRQDGLVTLKVLPQGDQKEADALLLLLYGYRRLKGEENILATRLIRAAKHSGLDLQRVNRVQAELTQWVMRGGQRKGATYTLNNQGVIKAQEIASKMF